ncbi:hypothetical protein JOM56_009330 [Amanita muscaria]
MVYSDIHDQAQEAGAVDSSPVRLSVLNAEDADILFKSSDKDFHHRIQTWHGRGRTIGGEFTVTGPRVALYVRVSKADAAEKYRVFSAMAIRNIYMAAAVSEHPIEALRYAVIHRYIELVDSAAKLAIGKATDLVALALPANAVVAWVQYYRNWQNVLADEVYASSQCSELLKISRIGRLHLVMALHNIHPYRS